MASFNMSSGISLRSFTFAPHIHCHSFSSSPMVACYLSIYLVNYFRYSNNRRNRNVLKLIFCAITAMIVYKSGDSVHCLFIACMRLASSQYHQSNTYTENDFCTSIVILRVIARFIVARKVFLVLIPQNTIFKTFSPRGDNKKK